MKHFSNNQLSAANSADLISFLNNHGISIKPGTRIHSPFRKDINPSFSVFRGSDGIWRGKDHATGENYNAIQLVQIYLNLDFVQAVKAILLWQGQPHQQHRQAQVFHRNATATAVPYTANPRKERTVQNFAILADNTAAIRYLTETRGISAEALAGVQVETVIITSKNGKYRNLYAAFPKLSGGYVCRTIQDKNPVRVMNHGPVGLWLQGNSEVQNIYIFESIIDALSWKTMFQKIISKGRVQLISINSVSNYKLLGHLDFSEKKVWLCMDRGKSGDDATGNIIKLLQGKCLSVQDVRDTELLGHKDVNEVLQAFLLQERRAAE